MEKMKQRALSLAISLAMILSLFPMTALAADCQAEVTFDITNASVYAYYYSGLDLPTDGSAYEVDTDNFKLLSEEDNYTFTKDNFVPSGADAGRVVFFVVPDENHLITQFSTVNGQKGGKNIVGIIDGTEVTNYPYLPEIAAYAMETYGAVAVFMYSRTSNYASSFSDTITIDAVEGALDVTAQSNANDVVIPGDVITFTITLKPTAVLGAETALDVTDLTLNSGSALAHLSELTQNEDGSYSATLQYTVTEDDVTNGTVCLSAEATIGYTLTATANIGGSQITTSSQVEAKSEVVSVSIYEDKVGETDDNGNDIGDGIPDMYQAKVTYTVANGSWNDKTSSDVVKYVTLTDENGDRSQTGSYTLTSSDIPAVGDQPATGYKAGDWAQSPSDAVITKDGAAFAYTYLALDQYLVTVQYLLEDTDTALKTAESQNYNEGASYDVTEYAADEITGTDGKHYVKVSTDGDLTGTNLSANVTVKVYYALDEDDTSETPEPSGTPEPSTTPRPSTTPVVTTTPVPSTTPETPATTETPTTPETPSTPATPTTPVIPSYPSTSTPTTNPGNTGTGNGNGSDAGTGDDLVNIDDEDVPLAGDAQLNDTDHFAYIKGYEDGTVRPTNSITREEVATIFYRLLTDLSRTIYFTEENDFSDVDSDRWSNKAISTLANAGILTGYPDGTFQPAKTITRAEFAAIAARFDVVTETVENPFTDTADHWAEQLISFAASKGWVNGYPDGTFQPEQAITRAEAMTLINRVLDREVDEEGLLAEAKQWSDNEKGQWYYYAVLEATNSHDYERRVENEVLENWIALTQDKTWDE